MAAFFSHCLFGTQSYCTDVNAGVVTRYIMLFYLICRYKVKDTGRLCAMRWFFKRKFPNEVLLAPSGEGQAGRQGLAESFPTQSGLKLNTLCRQQTRVEAAGGGRSSQMFAHYGVTKLSSRQVKGRARSRHVSRPRFLIVYFGPVSLNTPERLLFLPDDL